MKLLFLCGSENYCDDDINYLCNNSDQTDTDMLLTGTKKLAVKVSVLQNIGDKSCNNTKCSGLIKADNSNLIAEVHLFLIVSHVM